MVEHWSRFLTAKKPPTNVDKAVDNYTHVLEFVPDCYMTQKMCDKAVETHPFTIEDIPDQFNPFMHNVVKWPTIL